MNWQYEKKERKKLNIDILNIKINVNFNKKSKIRACSKIEINKRKEDQRISNKLPTITTIKRTIMIKIISSQKTSFNLDNLYISDC